jgi:hypothetical protein
MKNISNTMCFIGYFSKGSFSQSLVMIYLHPSHKVVVPMVEKNTFSRIRENEILVIIPTTIGSITPKRNIPLKTIIVS